MAEAASTSRRGHATDQRVVVPDDRAVLVVTAPHAVGLLAQIRAAARHADAGVAVVACAMASVVAAHAVV